MDRYRNILTNEFAEVIEDNEKYKTVLLKLENGKTKSMTYSTFHKEWKKLNQN